MPRWSCACGCRCASGRIGAARFAGGGGGGAPRVLHAEVAAQDGVLLLFHFIHMGEGVGGWGGGGVTRRGEAVYAVCSCSRCLSSCLVWPGVLCGRGRPLAPVQPGCPGGPPPPVAPSGRPPNHQPISQPPNRPTARSTPTLLSRCTTRPVPASPRGERASPWWVAQHDEDSGYAEGGGRLAAGWRQAGSGAAGC